MNSLIEIMSASNSPCNIISYGNFTLTTTYKDIPTINQSGPTDNV